MRNIILAAILAATSAPAFAISLIGGMGGAAGFGQLSQGRNDDSSSGAITMPFDITFFGERFDRLFVNNNGNVTFRGPLSSFTPRPFPVSNQPMIAAYWADVDTRPLDGGEVYIGAAGIDGRQAAVVTWNNVGYYPSGTDKTNNFQLALIDRNDTGNGNFDIQFRYDRLEWTTGSASGGSGGLGGIPAQAGYDAGDGKNFLTLPGSRTDGVLALADTSNVGDATPGLWMFSVRNGATPEMPILPDVITPDGYDFEIEVPPEQPVFIDPIVSVGYDYIVNSGANITAAWFPELGDPDGYEILGWDGAAFTVALGSIGAEQWFDFTPGGVDRFAVRGIAPALLLDPEDPQAFVTGLRFAAAGAVNISMNPITFDYDPPVDPPISAVPEPATWAMMIVGFGLVGGFSRRRGALAR